MLAAVSIHHCALMELYLCLEMYFVFLLVSEAQVWVLLFMSVCIVLCCVRSDRTRSGGKKGLIAWGEQWDIFRKYGNDGIVHPKMKFCHYLLMLF